MGPTSSNESCHNFSSLLRRASLTVDFIELIIRLHPEQLKEVDADGNLPLHIAAASSTFTSINKTLIVKELLDAYPEGAKVRNNEGNLPLHLRSSSKGNVDDFDMLLAEYPDAVKIPNNYGKLPLFMALEVQMQWYDGVEELVNAFPAVTVKTDIATNLFPFMTAASKETGSCLDSVYSLLRACPEMNLFYRTKAKKDNQKPT
eukprot:CAMPEP_0195538496 /NCGR_PEP_ID=MMETSP0794_2-20130614/49559_1 /TAXON_ID=515487 /ORGANISM="Stephanopyxis turris, Strain CCMP 815" /LENGTH=202 /DNA_ID=CAMNT_0040672479 /DNA_START=1013 /DNA_END=1621 /DNA_ORIENTATION=-